MITASEACLIMNNYPVVSSGLSRLIKEAAYAGEAHISINKEKFKEEFLADQSISEKAVDEGFEDFSRQAVIICSDHGYSVSVSCASNMNGDTEKILIKWK